MNDHTGLWKMKIAIVTGASSGIGAEFARQLANSHSLDSIWLIARNTEKLQTVSSELSVPSRIFTISLDERDAYSPLLQILLEEKPTIEVLVNSAGFGKNGDFSEISLDAQLQMIDINCRAVVQMTQEVVPYMHNNSIVYNISSISGFAPLGAFAIYGATKAFVNSFSIALKAELQKKGIRVLTVAPGSVNTNFQNISRGSSNRKKKMFAKKSSPKDVVKRALDDGSRNSTFSLFGSTANAARFLRRFIPHKFLASLSYTKIYPKK